MDSETYIVICPSGMAGYVRPIRVKDMSTLANRKARKRGADILGGLLSGIWIETTDHGVYGPDHGTVKVGSGISDWSQILLGDKAFLIIESRRLTWGNEFYFTVPCRNCKRPVEENVNLEDLKTTSLSVEAFEIIGEKGVDAVFYRRLPKAQVRVGFCLLRGYHQKNVAIAMEQGDDEAQIAGLLSRLCYIENATSPGDRRKFVENMHMLDVEYLREQWEEADIMVQDTVEIECRLCGTIQEVMLPTDERFFSVRSTRQTK